MSDLSAILWLLMLGFWAGFSFREWGYGRADRQPSPHEVVGTAIIRIAEEIADTRRFTGPDVTITQKVTLKHNGARFRITMDDSPVLPLSSAGRAG